MFGLLKEFKVSTKSSVKLVFAGKKGWLFEDVFEFVKVHKLQHEVIFTGFVSDEEKLYLLRNATAFLFLSIYEGFGIPPLEALKLGVPTLVSDISVFRELFEKSVTYVDPMDQEAITASMSQDTSRAAKYRSFYLRKIWLEKICRKARFYNEANC